MGLITYIFDTEETLDPDPEEPEIHWTIFRYHGPPIESQLHGIFHFIDRLHFQKKLKRELSVMYQRIPTGNIVLLPSEPNFIGRYIITTIMNCLIALNRATKRFRSFYVTHEYFENAEIKHHRLYGRSLLEEVKNTTDL